MEVDAQLMEAAQLQRSPGWQKLVILLLDEMHIKEGLVYSKNTGNIIGFANVGDINNHLLEFERLVNGSDGSLQHSVARTMMVMMVRGLFSTLRFPYARLPCARLTGDLLFWEAVYRLEKMGLKVSSYYKV